MKCHVQECFSLNSNVQFYLPFPGSKRSIVLSEIYSKLSKPSIQIAGAKTLNTGGGDVQRRVPQRPLQQHHSLTFPLLRRSNQTWWEMIVQNVNKGKRFPHLHIPHIIHIWANLILGNIRCRKQRHLASWTYGYTKVWYP